MTLFPDTVSAVLGESILGRAAKKGILDIRCVQIRDYTTNKQCQVDDYPYGGGFGCVLMAQPLKACLDDILATRGTGRSRVIYMSPQGPTFTQETAKRLVRDYDHLVLVCGHYEGIDERFISACVDEELSLGDFVLTGGEIAAMAVTDAVCRLVPGVLADPACYMGESHWDGLLEYPQYTRPETWEGQEVPEILRSGDHQAVERWRRKQSIARTMDKRPDLFEKWTPEGEDKALLQEILAERAPKEERLDFDIRPGMEADLPAIMDIVSGASAFLREQGVDQWQKGYPAAADYRRDMESGYCWVLTVERAVAGVMALCPGPESCYEKLDAWRFPGPYAVIHRIATRRDLRGRGLAKELFAFAGDIALGRGCASLRVDTHPDNRVMQGLIRKLGYVYRGDVYLESGTEAGTLRLAYEKSLLSGEGETI